jgi:hypothetical protein
MSDLDRKTAKIRQNGLDFMPEGRSNQTFWPPRGYSASAVGTSPRGNPRAIVTFPGNVTLGDVTFPALCHSPCVRGNIPSEGMPLGPKPNKRPSQAKSCRPRRNRAVPGETTVRPVRFAARSAVRCVAGSRVLCRRCVAVVCHHRCM